MAAGDGGSIINVSTIGSLRPGSNELVYACVKAGLNAVTIGLAEAFGPKVRVNDILPGAVLTDITDAWSQEQKESAARSSPLGRAGEASDFVGPALWLASDAVRLGDGCAAPSGRRRLPPDELTSGTPNSVLR